MYGILNPIPFFACNGCKRWFDSPCRHELLTFKLYIMVDYLNEKYSITDVMDSMLEFEKRTGESFFDTLLESVDGKNIRACREKEIISGIIISDEYDLYIVKDEIGIVIKRQYVMNMFDNFEDFVSEHTKEVELEII